MDYELLVTPGNVGFYQSCEVTEIFLSKKSTKEVYNFYTLVVFEEKQFSDRNKMLLGDRIKIDKDYSIGIGRYHLSLDEAKNSFSKVKESNYWSMDEKKSSLFSELKLLSKQYIPSIDGSRINRVLKNNHHSGSYIIEFFDESKVHTVPLLQKENIEKYNKICQKIVDSVSIDLTVARDRIGNIIFQFPITVLETSSSALPTWDGIKIKFAWHSLINALPNCFIQVETIFDQNHMGAALIPYDKLSQGTLIKLPI